MQGGGGRLKLRARRQQWHKAKSRGGRMGCAGVGSACSCPLTSQAPSCLQSEISSGEGHVGEADGSLDVVVTLQDGDAGGEPSLEGRTQWDTCKGGNHTLSCSDPAFQQAAVFQQQKHSWRPARRPHCMAWRSQFLSQPLPPDCEKEALELCSETQC